MKKILVAIMMVLGMGMIMAVPSYAEGAGSTDPGSGNSSNSSSGNSNSNSNSNNGNNSNSGSSNSNDKNCVSTSILGENGEYCDDGEGSGIVMVLGIVVDVLTFGIGVAATIGLVLSGVQYLTAGDNAGQIQKAKTRIFHIVIGLVIYAVFFGIIQFLLPGGLFGDGS